MRPSLFRGFVRPGASHSATLLAVYQLLFVCSGRASDCPADVKGIGGQSLLQHSRVHEKPISTSADGLYIVIPTGIQTAHITERMQRSMLRRLRPQDRFVHVCDEGCKASGNVSLLQNVVEMDKSIFPGGECTVHGIPCFGHMEAQMKFVFGLIHQVQKLKRDGAEMPAWWLVKDDDTYVHIANLMKSIKGYRHSDLVAFGDVTCTGLCGGAGWLMSNALAEKLAIDHAFRWIQLMDKMRLEPQETLLYCFDMHIAKIVSWVHEAQLFWHPGMLFASPLMDRCTNSSHGGLYWSPSHRDIFDRKTGEELSHHGPDWKAVVRPLPQLSQDIGACHVSSACQCAFSSEPCTWHLQASKGFEQFEAAIELLDRT